MNGWGSAFGPRPQRPKIPCFIPPLMEIPAARLWLDEITHAGRDAPKVLDRYIDRVQSTGPDPYGDAVAAEVLLGLRALQRYAESVKHLL